MKSSLLIKIAYILILGIMLICSYHLITMPHELQISEEYVGMVYVDEAGILIQKYDRHIIRCNESGSKRIIFIRKTNLNGSKL
jgi:hypothetical protein